MPGDDVLIPLCIFGKVATPKWRAAAAAAAAAVQNAPQLSSEMLQGTIKETCFT